MAPSALHGLFDIHPQSKVASPQPTYQKNKSLALRDIGVLPDVELESLPPKSQDISRVAGVESTESEIVAGSKTPHELERSYPATPAGEDAVGLMRTWNSPPMTKWRILCCCLIYFSNGINDSGKCSRC